MLKEEGGMRPVKARGGEGQGVIGLEWAPSLAGRGGEKNQEVGLE